eukprot:scaffold6471_cov114-Cylindrotheca_fusiformis.AAC.1
MHRTKNFSLPVLKNTLIGTCKFQSSLTTFARLVVASELSLGLLSVCGPRTKKQPTRRFLVSFSCSSGKLPKVDPC